MSQTRPWQTRRNPSVLHSEGRKPLQCPQSLVDCVGVLQNRARTGAVMTSAAFRPGADLQTAQINLRRRRVTGLTCLITQLTLSARALPESGIAKVFNGGRNCEGLAAPWAGDGDTPLRPELIRAAASRGARRWRCDVLLSELKPFSRQSSRSISHWRSLSRIYTYRRDPEMIYPNSFVAIRQRRSLQISAWARKHLRPCRHRLSSRLTNLSEMTSVGGDEPCMGRGRGKVTPH